MYLEQEVCRTVVVVVIVIVTVVIIVGRWLQHLFKFGVRRRLHILCVLHCCTRHIPHFVSFPPPLASASCRHAIECVRVATVRTRIIIALEIILDFCTGRVHDSWYSCRGGCTVACTVPDSALVAMLSRCTTAALPCWRKSYSPQLRFQGCVQCPRSAAGRAGADTAAPPAAAVAGARRGGPCSVP